MLTSSASHFFASTFVVLVHVRLVYWVVYGLFNMFESLSDFSLSWLPIYHPLKLLFLLWCFLPQYQGSQLVFDILVRPVLIRHESAIEASVETAQQGKRYRAGKQQRSNMKVHEANRSTHPLSRTISLLCLFLFVVASLPLCLSLFSSLVCVCLLFKLRLLVLAVLVASFDRRVYNYPKRYSQSNQQKDSFTTKRQP